MISVPMPMRMPPGGREMLMGGPSKPLVSGPWSLVSGLSWVHPGPHFADGLVDAGEQRPADDAVPDVEFVQMRQRAHLGDVNVVDPVPGVHDEPKLVALHGTAPQ